MYHRGRKAFKDFTRRTNPISPDDLTQNELLKLLDVAPKAAFAVLDATHGDVFALEGQSYRQLLNLHGVGTGTADKLQAILRMSQHFADRSLDIDQARELNKLFGKHEAQSLLWRAQGDLFTLAGVDHAELLQLDYVGPASVARLFALFSFVSRYVARRTPPPAPSGTEHYEPLEAA